MGFHSPSTLTEALRLLADGDVTVLAGGTDFYPALGQDAAPGNLVNISRIAELRGISRTEVGWRIGAATRWSEILKADLPSGFDGLKLAAREIGSVQIQNAGTIGGNLCNASPAADGIPPLLTLDANVEVASVSGSRIVPLEEFVLGVRHTARSDTELVTAIFVPGHSRDVRSHFLKLGARRYLVISIAMVSALIRMGRDNRIADCRIAVGSCSAVAKRMTALEGMITGMSFDDFRQMGEVWQEHLSGLSPISDPRGSADYRMETAGELCRRTVLACIKPEDGGIG